MDVKELRIGNYVYCKNENGVEIGRVYHLAERVFVSVKVGDVEYDGKAHNSIFCDAEPIPITEEILFNSGFKKSNNGYLNYLDCNDELSIRFSPNYTFIEYANLFHCPEDVTETNYSSSLEFPNTLHVHTLQNIWHLMTGKELEIKI